MRKMGIARIDNERWRESRRRCGWGVLPSTHTLHERNSSATHPSVCPSNPFRTAHRTRTPHARTHARTLTHTHTARTRRTPTHTHTNTHTRARARAHLLFCPRSWPRRRLRDSCGRHFSGASAGVVWQAAGAAPRRVCAGTCICSGRRNGGAATVGLNRGGDATCAALWTGYARHAPPDAEQRLARGAPRRCA